MPTRAHALSPDQREAFLLRCWTSHDAKWFAVTTAALGIESANRLSRAAAHAQGKAEATEILRALGLPVIADLADYLAVQEILFDVLTPGLLEHEIERLDDRRCRIRIRRCVVSEAITQIGVAGRYECSVFARLAGWLQALDQRYVMGSCPEGCPLTRGGDCVFTIALGARSAVDGPLTACS
jgi:hypothetical protein